MDVDRTDVDRTDVDGMDVRVVDRIDALLPQTQCTKCGYDGCRPYAEAIARDGAPINRCPPGGVAGIAALARLLDRAPLPLDAACGVEQPHRVAVIDEIRCIGCTLCIQACPVDAIVGAPKRMHTVFATLCSGCDLCLPPCPVDCIAMVVPTGPDAVWDAPRRDAARARHDARAVRLEREAQRMAARRKASGGREPGAGVDASDRDVASTAAQRDDGGAPSDLLDVADKRAVIEAALARVRAKRAARGEQGR